MATRIRSLLLLFFELVGSVWGQTLSLGVKGGLRSTEDVSGFSVISQESQRYIVGPFAEFRLPWHISVEVDALFRRVGYTSGFGNVLSSGIIRERSNSWEFPMVAKYRLPFRLVHPFVGVGYAPRVVHGSDISSGQFLSSPTTYTSFVNQRSDTQYSPTHGIVAAGGVDWGGRPFGITCELRFVHWNDPYLQQYGGDGSYFIQSSQNEVFLMVGIRFR